MTDEAWIFDKDGKASPSEGHGGKEKELSDDEKWKLMNEQGKPAKGICPPSF